jgi:hypothetical protein
MRWGNEKVQVELIKGEKKGEFRASIKRRS